MHFNKENNSVQSLFFDDRLENLFYPHSIGWITVWIINSSNLHSLDIHNIPYVDYYFFTIESAIQYFIHHPILKK
jgi:hypothetical protein